MEFTRIKETCLYIQDIERTEQFYHGLLGLPVIRKEADRFVFFRAGESVLLCFIAAASSVQTQLPPHGGSGCLHFAFETLAYDLAKNEIQGKGIEILQEVTWPSGSRSFYFKDPDGHMAEIMEPGLWD